MRKSVTEREKIFEWKKILENAYHPVAITGAGISVASGLPTVSSEWKGIDLREFFTAEMIEQDTKQYFASYKKILQEWKLARPNHAHIALAKSKMPIVTQNIDGLHQMAGSPHVLELHGNLLELLCRNCKSIHSSDRVFDESIPFCPTCGGLLKPNIVLVGEEVYHYGTAVDWVGRSDVLLIVGTRLEMAPCNNLPCISDRKGVPIIEINSGAETILPALFG